MDHSFYRGTSTRLRMPSRGRARAEAGGGGDGYLRVSMRFLYIAS